MTTATLATKPATSERTIVRRLVKAVDNLGGINAQISRLQSQADMLKAQLKASAYDEVIGEHYRAVISTATTARLDTKAVRKLLTPAQVDECTVDKTTTSISLYDL